jgi:hypothetical protein
MQRAVFAGLRALGWATFLPLFGFSVFTLLTFFPVLGFVWGPAWVFKIIMAAGFVPSLCTALVYEFALRDRPVIASTVLTCICGVLFAAIWYFSWGGADALGPNYATFALVVATIASVSMMPLITFGYRQKLAREAMLNSSAARS